MFKFNAEVEPSVAMRIARVDFFEQGHSFEEIDRMTLKDYADIAAVRTAKAKMDKGRGKR